MNLVQMGLQGSVLIVIVLVVRALFGHRMPKVVLPVLWAVILVRLLVPICIVTPWSAWTFAGQGLAQTAAVISPSITEVLPLEALSGSVVASAHATVATPATSSPTDPTSEVAASAGTLAQVQTQTHTPADSRAPSTSVAPAVPEGSADNSALDNARALMTRARTQLAAIPQTIGTAWARLAPWQIVWGIGTTVCALTASILYLHFVRRFRHAVPIADPFALKRLQAHPLRRRVRICACGLVHSPLTYGLLRPTILVPPDFDWSDRVSAGLMLEHEFVHIRRWDIAFKAALVAATCLYWFNPLVWVAYVLANRDLELSCDELVLRRLNDRGRAAYATALIDVAEAGCGLLPTVAGFGTSDLTRRVLAIVRPAQPRVLATAAAILLVTVATTAFATTGIIPATEATQAQSAPDVQGIRVTGGDGAPSSDGAANTAVVPETLGSLVRDGGDPVEFSREGYRYVVTSSYALVLPESQVTEGFAWNFDDTTEYVATHETEVQGSVTATATDVLTVEGVLDTAGQSISFKVYQQTANEYKAWGGPCPLGEGYAYQRLTYNTYAAVNDGSTPEAHGLERLISTGGYAYAQPEAGGTRIMTPDYSVFVPDEALPEGWSFAASSDTYGIAFELRIYENAGARATDEPLIIYARLNEYQLEQRADDGRAMVNVEEPTSESGYALRAFGPVLEVGEQDSLWESSRQQAEEWADRVSFDITQQTARSVAITRDVWHIETPYYSFDVPEFWRDRVTASFKADGTLSLYPNEHPELILIQIMAYGPDEELRSGGDIAAGIIFEAENTEGAHVLVYMVNYVYFDTSGGWHGERAGLAYPGDNAAREVIDLSTGGAHSLKEIEAMPEYGDINGFAYGRELAESNLHVCDEVPTGLPA